MYDTLCTSTDLRTCLGLRATLLSRPAPLSESKVAQLLLTWLERKAHLAVFAAPNHASVGQKVVLLLPSRSKPFFASSWEPVLVGG